MGFVGLNGPYQVDDDHDGVYDRIANPDAVGIELSDVDVGLALYIDPNADRSWLSAKAEAASAIQRGIPVFDMDVSNLGVVLNVGTDGETVIDFAVSAQSM